MFRAFSSETLAVEDLEERAHRGRSTLSTLASRLDDDDLMRFNKEKQRTQEEGSKRVISLLNYLIEHIYTYICERTLLNYRRAYVQEKISSSPKWSRDYK